MLFNVFYDFAKNIRRNRFDFCYCISYDVIWNEYFFTISFVLCRFVVIKGDVCNQWRCFKYN